MPPMAPNAWHLEIETLGRGGAPAWAPSEMASLRGAPGPAAPRPPRAPAAAPAAFLPARPTPEPPGSPVTAAPHPPRSLRWPVRFAFSSARGCFLTHFK